ncbi:MAG: phage minor head protein [Nitrospirota bacterium]|nr:phage minor head protein [Nitrospirota bacterium]
MARKTYEPLNFFKSGWIGEKYARQLRDVAREVARIIEGHDPLSITGVQEMQYALHRYAGILMPWAVKTAGKVGEQLDRQDFSMWNRHSQKIGSGLRELVRRQPAGEVIQDFLARQVHYITSLPIEEGQRVHRLSMEAMTGGKRPKDIAEELLDSGQVSKSRATLIARTECARTASALTMTRGKGVGATHAIWRTAKDKAVRPSHREMEGKTFDLYDPPTLSDGTKTFPGGIYNCRCISEIIIPEI